MFDNKFFDPSNTWYTYDNRPLKESLEKFAKFPISTSLENNEPRLLLVAVDVQVAGYPVVFDSYEKEDGTRKTEYGRYGRGKFGSSEKDQENTEGYEYVIRYEDGIKADFVLTSCSVPVNYDYTRLNVENRVLVRGGQGDNADTGDNNRPPSSSNANNSLHSFWDGGLLANTPLRQTILAHRDYWHQVRKVKSDIPKLRYVIINLHPGTHDYLPSDYDGVVDRKNDIIFHDRTRYDENVAVLVSDFIRLAKILIKLAEENGVSKEVIQKILEEETNAVYLATGKRWRFEDLLTIAVDIEYVVRFQRKNDSNTIANKRFDFSKAYNPTVDSRWIPRN